MSTQFTNRQWRLPNEENKSKVSNYSMDFDGSSQYIDIDSSSFGSDSFSISLWFKQDTGTSFQGLFAGSGYSGGTGFIIYTHQNTIKIYTAVSGSTTNILTSPTFSFDTWYHVTLKREYNVGWSLYIDGTEVDTYSSLTTTDLTSANTRIGKHYTSGLYFNGQIDGISIFDYALSSSQVTTLYGSSSTGIGNPMSLSPKPVAYYPLGDQDSFNGADYLVPNSSLKDYVFDFDGSNDYIDCGAISAIPSATQITVSFWANTDSTSQSQVVFGDNSSSPIFSFEYWGSSNKMFFEYGTGTYAYLTLTSVVTAGSWNNVAMVYDASGASNTDKIKIYVDGVDKSSLLTYVGTIPTSLNASIGDFWIGNGQNYNSPFNGKLSNFQIFNTALSATDLETLYNNGSPLTSMTGFTSLVSWYKLNASDTYDGTNWMIEDHAGSNDGTSSGMTQANLVQSDLSFTSGYSPYALSFDGTNEKIQYANGTIDLGLSSTETWWIKYSNSSATSSSIASAPVFAGFHILYEKSTNKVYYRIDSTNLYYEWVIPSTYFTDNLWHHYSIVRDDSLPFSSYIKLYIDGNLFGNPNAVNATSKSTTNTKITDWGGASAYSGIVADLSNIAVWNISLSSTEITEIFNSGVPSNLNNFSGTKPYSWWQLGSNMSYNSNWTILDEGTGNNNGSASNISEDSIVDGVASYANGTSSGMGGDEVVGDAPYSTANSLSVNMDVLDRTDDTPA